MGRPALAGTEAYSDTKLHSVLLAFAVARRWPGVLSNGLEPGWVPTKMGGPGATDDMDQAHRTQVWLAVSDDPAALVSDEYFCHMQKRHPLPAARDISTQDRLLDFVLAPRAWNFHPDFTASPTTSQPEQ
jgi:NAD(P)-dependent dehydrogenase (short-subunit alcohol dehydrogenase family)